MYASEIKLCTYVGILCSHIFMHFLFGCVLKAELIMLLVLPMHVLVILSRISHLARFIPITGTYIILIVSMILVSTIHTVAS